MKLKTISYQQLVSPPELAENLVGREPVKEGAKLPGSIEEDVGSFSLHPKYSRKQMRTIKRIKTNKIKNQLKHQNKVKKKINKMETMLE